MGNTMKANHLHRILTEAKLFAGHDATLPMLACVRLEATETQLTAIATDRFLLGVSRADYTGEAFDVLIDGSDVDVLARMAKTAKRDEAWREVTVERTDTVPEGCTVTSVTFVFAFNTGETLTVKPSEQDFPKYRQLIPSTDDLETETLGLGTEFGFDAGKLARFAKVAGSHVMQLYPRGPRPAVVLIGDDFLGLIMPVRLSEDHRTGYRRPAWIDA